ncbi:MAG: hypothetical protein ACJ8DJ_18435 [Gemmatimonadales bacterium]|jgi:hypothetical protein
MRRIAALALVMALAPRSARAQLPDTLQRQVPAGPGDLAAKVAGVCRVQVAPAYRYLGGQRFILQETADAEQHFYARADSSGKILQLYWFQVESKLPGKGAGYNYGRDSAVTINDLPFAVSLREARADADPPPGSDGAAMMDFVHAAGLVFPPMGRPLRMVHTAKPGARQELMVIYLESRAMAKADPSFDGVFKRGRRALRFFACH